MKTRNCPKCGAEYREDILICADCNINITMNYTESETTDLLIGPEEEAVAVTSGSAHSIAPLVTVLKENQIPYRIDESASTSEGITELSSEMHLMVREKDFERLHNTLENIKYTEFPELKQADQSLAEGLCPACGCKVMDEKICPECELPLVIEE